MNKNETIKLTKKQLLSIVLAFTMAGSLAACKKAENNTVATTTTTAVTTTTETSETESTKEYFQYGAEARKLYNDNKEFFINQYGQDEEYAVGEIVNALLVIRNEEQPVPGEELRRAFRAMEDIFVPTNAIQAAGNYVTKEPIEKVQNVPNLGQYIMDEQAKKIINDNTAIVNNFINALNNGTDEEKTNARNLLLQRIITIEENLDEYYYLGELSIGDELALNMSMKGLVNLGGTLCKNGELNYTDEKGTKQKMLLIPNVRGAAILNTFRFAEQEAKEKGTEVKYDHINVKTKNGKITIYGFNVEYLGSKGFVKEFISREEKETYEDILALTKYDEATTMIENGLSRKSAEYYSKSSDCEEKTYTR